MVRSISLQIHTYTVAILYDKMSLLIRNIAYTCDWIPQNIDSEYRESSFALLGPANLAASYTFHFPLIWIHHIFFYIQFHSNVYEPDMRVEKQADSLICCPSRYDLNNIDQQT